ncbi:MAG: DUF945 domain-containing protein [Deltaproteobacteria bacterium]|nr:DUF945 domain-containing protein [Deltaproteobacteria bacterium]
MNKNMTTLGKVAERVNALSRNCRDELIPVPEISFDGLETIKISNKCHLLRPMAQQSIAWRLGIPINYLRKCPSEVQAYNMNHWIKKEKNEELFFRFDGEEVRAIFTPRYRPVDNFEVLERLDSLGYGPDTQVQCHLDDLFLLVSILDGNQTFSINGDRFTPGISVSNSEVGLASLSIAAFFLRLVCTNGMVSKTEISASYRHISLKILGEFPKVLERVSSELTQQKSQFRISMQTPVENPLMTIESFNRQFQIGEKEREAVKWGWEQEMGKTMFHVVNAYTRAAEFEGLSAGTSYRLQKVGGMVLGMVK